MSLSQTFAMLSLIMLLSFAMAATTLSRVGLTSRMGERAVADGLARAGVNELILRAQAIQSATNVTDPPPAILSTITNNSNLPVTLVSPSGHVNGTVQLMPLLSRDNTQGAASVAGPFGDSVPPYGLCVGLQTSAGQHTYTYECLLQQRWPYALAAVGPIVLDGAINPAAVTNSSGFAQTAPPLNFTLWANPTIVTGRILAQSVTSLAHAAADSVGGSNGDVVPPVQLNDTTLYGRMLEFASSNGAGVPIGQPGTDTQVYFLNTNRLSIGGQTFVYDFLGFTTGGSAENPSYTAALNLYNLTTSGAQCNGNVDFWENGTDSRPATITTTDTVVGTINGTRTENSGSLPTTAAMRRILQAPTPWSPSNIIASGAYHSLNLNGAAPVLVNGNLVITPPTSGTGPSLNMTSAQLYVNGDLEVTGLLQGSDSTVIVNGTLSLDNTTLDAGGNGLVIWCQRLICCAQGSFHGLIIAQQGAAVYGGGFRDLTTAPPDGTPIPALTIDGGLIVGENQMQVQYTGGGVPSTPGAVFVQALGLVNTQLTYNPTYMRNLNGCGQWVISALQSRT